jgi:acetyl-CoA/propionyl-CoA carboxylase
MAKLNAWGQNFEEARVRLLDALADFYIQGVETSIPLYKTILKSKEFINGDLSTDFLQRYKIIDRLKEDIKNDTLQKQDAALAAAVIHSIHYKSRVQSPPQTNMFWKSKLDGS